MITQIEKTILSAYLNLEYFNRAVTAHISPEFFESDVAQIFAKECIDYTTKHKSLPTKTVLNTIFEEKFGLREQQYQQIVSITEQVYEKSLVEDIKLTESKWLLDSTENWCVERSAFNAVIKSMDILEGKDKKFTKSAIPELLQKAISISFDSNIGHDYIAENDKRYEYMHSPVAKIPFSIPILNEITGGGIERKAITVLVCPPHSGKTLTMGSWSADWIRMGYNVLVITLEMAEYKIGERIDANLLDVEIGRLKQIPKPMWDKKFQKMQEANFGKLKIKEYPTKTAGASHFRFLLQELEVKENFIPDIIVVDYMGICASPSKSENMYMVQKEVGEALRALGQEKDVAVVTAVQTNKNGFGGNDFDMGDISESSAHAHTGDFMLALISTPELIELGQVRVKQLKNRWGSIHDNETFLLNMDRKKMRVWQEGGEYKYHKNQEDKKQIKDTVIEETVDDDKPFVFNRSMIKPKRDLSELQ